MLHLFRRLGIALGSLVAAGLGVGLVGGVLLSLFGMNVTTTTGQPQFMGGLVLAIVTIVLGGLIYRDIIGRERQRS